MPERRERPTICGYRIVSKMACNDLPQPVTLSWDRLVHSQPQLCLDFLELRLHAVAPGLPLKLEESPARFTADEGEAQKREGVRSTDTAFLAIDRRKEQSSHDAPERSRAHRNNGGPAVSSRPVQKCCPANEIKVAFGRPGCALN